MRRRFNRYVVECSAFGIANPDVAASSPKYAVERALQLVNVTGVKVVKVDDGNNIDRQNTVATARVSLLGGTRESVSYYLITRN